MLLTGSSDIIIDSRLLTIRGQTVEVLRFRDDRVLMISRDALGFYKNEQALNDELGNGLLAYVTLPDGQTLDEREGHLVDSFQAGYVALAGGKALLITPVAIQLFADKTDALYNRNEICRMDLRS